MLYLCNMKGGKKLKLRFSNDWSGLTTENHLGALFYRRVMTDEEMKENFENKIEI